MKAEFQYTIPIEKSEERQDGFYITGLASGTDIDAHGERMAPEAIASFARQISDMVEAGFPLTYRDAHLKDGVLTELGWITRAWITPDLELGIEVRLDVEDNAAAKTLWQKIKKGKQYGMSVSGTVLDFADEWVAEVGRVVRTYRDIVLEEISNTTRPAWYPSFGTVLSKAIEDAEQSESSLEGENPPMEEELQQDNETAAESTAEVNEAVAEEATNEAVEETVEATEVADTTVVEATAEEVTEEAAEEVQSDLKQVVLDLYHKMTEMLTGAGVLTVEPVAKSVSEDETETTLNKALEARDSAIAALTGQVEALTKSLTEATARIEVLENSPDGDAPELVERHELSRDEVAKTLAQMTPEERLRVGLAARFGE